jgi:hypothetical protein
MTARRMVLQVEIRLKKRIDRLGSDLRLPPNIEAIRFGQVKGVSSAEVALPACAKAPFASLYSFLFLPAGSLSCNSRTCI